MLGERVESDAARVGQTTMRAGGTVVGLVGPQRSLLTERKLGEEEGRCGRLIKACYYAEGFLIQLW